MAAGLLKGQLGASEINIGAEGIQHPPGHLCSQLLAGLVGEFVVNAAIDAAAARFRCRVLKRTEAAADIRQPDAGGVKGPIAQDLRQHLGCRRAVGGVTRYVFRMVWGDQQGLPVALSSGFGVTVAVGVANGRDRTPKVVGVFGVPGGDA